MILILATWRLTKLFTSETGPNKIFYRIRKYFRATDLTGEVEPDINGFFPEILSCFYCFSVWMGIGITAFSYPFVAQLTDSYMLQIVLMVCMPFALSGAAIVLKEFLTQPEIYE